jgi:hypothetical protein
MRAADEALYLAKDAGRNRAVVHPSCQTPMSSGDPEGWSACTREHRRSDMEGLRASRGRRTEASCP